MSHSVLVTMFLLALSYLLGSMPWGLWIVWAVKGKNVDITKLGSGNIGATNAIRVLGWAGLLVLAADVAKGAFPVWLCKHFVGNDIAIIFCVFAAAVGHTVSVILKMTRGSFKGGKAVATFLGGIVIAQPLLAVYGLGVFILMVALSGYVSLASLCAALSVFILACVFHLSWPWIIALAIVVLFLAWTHRSNIARLVAGTEPKINEKKVATAAFIIHAVTPDDWKQSRLLSWLFDFVENGMLTLAQASECVLKYCQVLEVDQITGIKTANGKKAKDIIEAVPLLPEQILDPANAELVDRMLKEAVESAAERGAKVFGLGALLSVFAKGGSELQKWVQERKLGIQIDNGAAYTAVTTIQALLKVIGDRQLSDLVIANVGASGLIGHLIVRILEQMGVKKIIAVARSRQKIEDLAGIADLATSDELQALAEADVVIWNTSSPIALVDKDNHEFLKKDSILLDVGVPSNVNANVKEVRPDIKIIRCGLVLLPGEYSTRVDFHFGKVNVNGRDYTLVPACLAQGLLLALTGEYQHASLGARIRLESAEFFQKKADEFGFQVIASELSEPEVFGRLSK